MVDQPAVPRHADHSPSVGQWPDSPFVGRQAERAALQAALEDALAGRAHDATALQADMGVGAADLVTLAPEMREHLRDLPRDAPIEDPEQARFRLFTSMTTFLLQAAQRQPLVLVLENLHGADKPSLLLLEFLAQEVAKSRVLVLGTYRDIELSRQHPLTDTLAGYCRGAVRQPQHGGQPRAPYSCQNDHRQSHRSRRVCQAASVLRQEDTGCL